MQSCPLGFESTSTTRCSGEPFYSIIVAVVGTDAMQNSCVNFSSKGGKIQPFLSWGNFSCGRLCMLCSTPRLPVWCFRYSGVFPSLNMAVKRREQALQDYKRLQSKVEKYEEKEKTGPVMVKLHQVPPVCIRAHVKSAKTLVASRGAGFTCSYTLHTLGVELDKWEKTQMLTGCE